MTGKVIVVFHLVYPVYQCGKCLDMYVCDWVNNRVRKLDKFGNPRLAFGLPMAVATGRRSSITDGKDFPLAVVG